MFLCHFKLYNLFKSLSLRLVIQVSLVVNLLMLTGVVQADTQRNSYDQQQVESLQAKLTDAAKGYYTQVKSYGKSASAKAQDYQRYARDYAHITSAKLSDAQTQMQNYFQDYMDDIRQQLVTPNEDFHGVYIFASLGMPIETLRVLNKQAAALKIPLLIQGLYGDSFESTYARIEQILLPEGRDEFNPKIPPVGGFAIDPLRFKQFKITQVPAFVISHNVPACVPASSAKAQQNNPFEYDCPLPVYDVVYGNISVYDALSILYKKSGEAFKSSLSILLDKARKLREENKADKVKKSKNADKVEKTKIIGRAGTIDNQSEVRDVTSNS
ncbi:type-F conjugative transfer system pilin assembly protein TrbC [Cysteiniphilum sp. SYW-8]|uniref:type-F conjugative transfer system pilin assembly protein TrbC n=2 Tax=Cysteiniphilum TaxID=2056696 RepID=UPI00123CB526|nr:type-F conjugative transfer system pilin assembly protein TrbC [Cysteiniphilum sp. SYW-8]